jgi:hypothetical protein
MFAHLYLRRVTLEKRDENEKNKNKNTNSPTARMLDAGSAKHKRNDPYRGRTCDLGVISTTL